MNDTFYNKNLPVPLYDQIAAVLRNKITDQEWLPKDKLPSENELSSMFQVSRVTIRLALQELEKEGYIEKVRGKGTFVKVLPEPIIHDFSLPATLSAKIGKGGINIDASILSMKIKKGIPMINKHLSLLAYQKLVYIQRLFSVNDHPVSINESWISADLVPGIIEGGLMNGHLSSTLAERYDLKPARTENSVEALNASAATSHLLEIGYNTPIFRVTSISYLPYDTPLEYSKTLWRGDRVRFHFNLN